MIEPSGKITEKLFSSFPTGKPPDAGVAFFHHTRRMAAGINCRNQAITLI